jgi:hypothetical protein
MVLWVIYGNYSFRAVISMNGHCRYGENIILTMSLNGLWLLVLLTHVHLSSHLESVNVYIKITVLLILRTVPSVAEFMFDDDMMI